MVLGTPERMGYIRLVTWNLKIMSSTTIHPMVQLFAPQSQAIQPRPMVPLLLRRLLLARPLLP